MPRILIDARSLADSQSGGVNRVAKLWILNQIKDVDHNHCFCLTTGLKPSIEVINFCKNHNLNYLHLKIPNKLWTFLCYFNFSSLILSAENKLKSQIDLLLLPNLAYTGPIYRPYHILVHDLSFIIEPHWFNLRRRLWHKFINANLRIKHAHKIYCVSNQTKSDVIKLLNVANSKCQLFQFDPKIKTLQNKNCKATIQENTTCEVNDIKPYWIPVTATRIALMLGGSNPRKNIITALKAIAEFNIKNPKHFLTPVVLGGKVKFSFSERNISYVQAPNYLSDKELIWLYQNSSVLLYPSWYEGFGLPLHEANQFNLPIISSTTGALTETAPPNTILCNPTKIHEWIGGLEILIKPII